MPQEPRRTTDEIGDSTPAGDVVSVGDDPIVEEPIMVKRTPRLRSGKHEEPEPTE